MQKELVSIVLKLCSTHMHTKRIVISIGMQRSGPAMHLSVSVRCSVSSVSFCAACACAHGEYVNNWGPKFCQNLEAHFLKCSVGLMQKRSLIDESCIALPRYISVRLACSLCFFPSKTVEGTLLPSLLSCFRPLRPHLLELP